MLLRIDVATGGTVLDAVDVRQPGLMPFVLARRYESARPSAGAFGPGWRHGFEVSLELSDEAVTVRGGLHDGVAFMPVDVGREARIDDRGLVLQHHPDVYVLFESRRRQWVFPHGDGRGALQPAAVRDGAGSVLRLEHRGPRLAAIVGPEGRRLRLTWAGDRLAGIEREAAGRLEPACVYSYGARGELVSVTNAMGRATRYGYDGGLLVSVIHAGGGRQFACYGEDRRCAALWDDAGTVLHAAHDPARMTARTWDRDGAQTIFRHAGGKAVLERLAPAGPSQGFYYDEAERLIGHSRDDGTIRTFQRLDPATMELSHIAGNRLAFVQYDEGGAATSLASADEHVTSLENGADGLPRALVDAHGARWAFERDRQGRVTAVVSPEGRRLAIRWSRQHRQVDGPAGVLRRDSLDEAGRATLTGEAGGRERRYLYDPEGRLVQAASGGFAVEFLYDRDGHLVSTVDTERRRYRVAVDLHGQATDAELDGRRFSVRYDASGRLMGIAEGEGRRAIARYDSRDRLAQIDGPAGPVVTYTYEDDDTVTARGASQEARYDAGGALLAHVRGGRRDAYTYGSAGELLVWERSDDGLEQTAIFEYDAAARLAAVDWVRADGDLGQAAIGYDKDGLLTSLRVGEREVTVTRGPLGQPASLTLGEQEVTCAFDGSGRMTRLAGASGAVEFRYDDIDRPIGAVVTEGDGQQRVDLRQPGAELRAEVAPGIVALACARGVVVAGELEDGPWPLYHRGEVRADQLDASRALVVARVAGWQAVLRAPDVHGPAALARWRSGRLDDDATAVPSSAEVGVAWPALDHEILRPGVTDAHAGRLPGSLPAHQRDPARTPYDLASGLHRCGPLRPTPWAARDVSALLALRELPPPRGFDLAAALRLLTG